MKRTRRTELMLAILAAIGALVLFAFAALTGSPRVVQAQGWWWATPTPSRQPAGEFSIWNFSQFGNSSSSFTEREGRTRTPTPPYNFPPFSSSSSRSSSSSSSSSSSGNRTPTPIVSNTPFRVIAWNDLGMHCMNESFENLAVLPPYNTLWAQVIKPGLRPQIVTTGVTVNYNIVDNTYSAGKTNFWQFAAKLFPGSPAATQSNVGLTGARLAGQMNAATDHFVIEGVPLTPYRDSAPQPGPQNWYPYQLAHMVVRDPATGNLLGETTTVAPVSTEMRCDTCHADGMRNGIATGNVETNILMLHDQKEKTNLMAARPVLCATCHASNALGAPGFSTIPNLSLAMHNQHAEVTNDCYLCHPGQKTQCLRDVMFMEGLTCTNCHGDVKQVANPNRRPWIDEPHCGNCHEAKFAENPGQLYRNSKGHGGLYCEACHGSPHAILPTNQPNDNIQSVSLQGHAGTIKECRVCHTAVPSGKGPHE